MADKPKRRLIPHLVFFPVNQEIIKRFVKPFLTGGLLATVVGGIGALSSKFWDQVPTLMKYFDIKDSLLIAQPTFLKAILFAVLALTLLGAIVTRLFDFQLIYSVARTFLFLSLYYVICATISLFPGSLVVHVILAVLVLFIGIVRYFIHGSLGYYWNRKSYGDVALESIIMFALIYFAWSPIYGLVTQGVAS